MQKKLSKLKYFILNHIKEPLNYKFIVDETKDEICTMQCFDYADDTRKAIPIWEPKNRYFIYNKK